jgi:methyltransferase (TIGR00027 family)
MTQNQAGVTALVTAYARAYHATHDFPKIFDDTLADQLYSTDEHLFFDQNIAGMLKLVAPELAAENPGQEEALALVMQLMNGSTTLSRSRYTEDCLEEAVLGGIRQYVILGAGMDTFAFRRPEWAKGLDVYEVDHPVTQAMKLDRVKRAGWSTPDTLHFLPVDFQIQDLAEQLRLSGYSSEIPGFYSWLGVIYYLDLEVVQTTLRKITEVTFPGSVIVFDYMGLDALNPGKASRQQKATREVVRQSGEPFKTFFDPAELRDLLASLGWKLLENLSPAEIESRYFSGRSDRYHASEHVHFARAVVME